MQLRPTPSPQDRTDLIRRARQQVLERAPAAACGLLAPWIERSWQRCMAQGHRPDQGLHFDTIAPSRARAAAEAHQRLVAAARPVLERLAQALAQTRYFPILTNAEGVVVDAQGAIDPADRRATLVSRIGTDLSEAHVGTTAIGAALLEQQPVWLHRGEHFFADTGAYSCAGAPVRGPDGACAGMLDLTGIDVAERPELKHLAAHGARSIENALTLARPHALLLRLNWPGVALGGDGDGLLCLDADGLVTGANPPARAMLALPVDTAAAPVHASELFATPPGSLFDAGRNGQPLEVPLWSGLRLAVQAGAGAAVTGPGMPAAAVPLKALESALIRKAVVDARGNVALAAHRLGISRATVYRKLGKR
jgi:transcriptional regulator of acetoin/glycerol metabolism